LRQKSRIRKFITKKMVFKKSRENLKILVKITNSLHVNLFFTKMCAMCACGDTVSWNFAQSTTFRRSFEWCITHVSAHARSKVTEGGNTYLAPCMLLRYFQRMANAQMTQSDGYGPMRRTRMSQRADKLRMPRMFDVATMSRLTQQLQVIKVKRALLQNLKIQLRIPLNLITLFFCLVRLFSDIIRNSIESFFNGF